MQISRRVIIAAVFLSAVGIYLSSHSETVVDDSLSTIPPKSCFGDYCIGDLGPGGGTIVYISETGLYNVVVNQWEDPIYMCLTRTCHYLEMAPADLAGQYSWQSAISAAEAFFTPSANDWVLPSMYSLNEMCKYAFGETGLGLCVKNENGTDATGLRFGGFSDSEVYWSSTKEADGKSAWIQKFYLLDGENSNSGGLNFKYRPGLVRPVRIF